MTQFMPFLREFWPLIRDGKKTCTARTRRYGSPGDVLDSPVGPLRLVLVEYVPLRFVQDHWWKEEGLSSPYEFVSTWERLHPRGFDEGRRVWLHVFEKDTP